MAQAERVYGEIPAWAKTGPITLRNYSYRAEVHCKTKTVERQGAHPTIQLGTDEFKLWRQYFEVHLGGLPMAMQRMLQNPDDQRHMSVPEPLPQWFDTSFVPNPHWQPREYVQMGTRARAREPIPEGQDYTTMVKQHGVPRPTK